jgi:predicted GIY-YIG superfamily endonuclease
MAEEKRSVYVLRSGGSRSRFYVGLTRDVDSRLADHNAGRCPHTARSVLGPFMSRFTFLTRNAR